MGVLHLAADSFANKMLTLKAQLGYRMNTRLLLHSLPPEIFQRILWFSLVLWHKNPYPRRLVQLRRVCKIWTEAIDANPIFYAYIDARSSTRAITYSKAASRNSPLYVRCDARSSNVGKFLSAAADDETLQRWQTLYFNGTHASFREVLERLKAAPTPRLSELFVYSNHSENGPTVSFQDEGTYLRTIHISGVRMILNSPRVRNLRSLQLSWADVPGPVSDLVNVLRLSPNLESLLLAHLRHVTSEETKLDDLEKISLPSLTNLELEDLPRDYYGIVKQIEAPRCQSFGMGADPNSGIDDSEKLKVDIWDPASRSFKLMSYPLLCSDVIKIEATYGDVRVHSNYLDVLVQLPTQTLEPRNLPIVLASLRTLPITAPIKLTQTCAREVPFSADKWYGGLPTLVELDVVGNDVMLSTLSFLSRQTDESWNAPNLRKLTFKSCSGHPLQPGACEALKTTVQERWGDPRQQYPRPTGDDPLAAELNAHGIPPYRPADSGASPSARPAVAPLIKLVLSGITDHFDEWHEAVDDCRWMVTNGRPEVLESRELHYRCSR